MNNATGRSCTNLGERISTLEPAKEVECPVNYAAAVPPAATGFGFAFRLNSLPLHPYNYLSPLT